MPAALVLKQPDLGTAMVLVMSGGAMFFLAGVRWWKFVIVLSPAPAAVPVAWRFLRDYQKNRIYTFLDPENDPLGAGYHSLQSKIAIGSGGVFGKGFMQGSQAISPSCRSSRPTSSSPCWPRNGAWWAAWCCWRSIRLVFVYGFAIAFRCRNQFGRLLALGITVNFFLYVFINIGHGDGADPGGRACRCR